MIGSVKVTYLINEIEIKAMKMEFWGISNVLQSDDKYFNKISKLNLPDQLSV